MTYTDYPKADIETHRSVAKWNKRVGGAVLLMGLYYSARMAADPQLAITATVAISALALSSANGLRLKALRWEIEQADNSGK